MAASSEDERALENQLELQLQDQRDSLAAIHEALASDPSNSELLAVSEELVEAIKEAEEALLHLKRARLLEEVDLVLLGSRRDGDENSEANKPLDPDDVDPQPLEDRNFDIGSKCRFRHTDGRWYNGKVLALEGSTSAKISFLTPTSESMLMCKFFLQQRCRFGTSCRLSHGVDVSLSLLRTYVPAIWEKSLVGSCVWAISDGGLWREAELESWDDTLRLGKVVFRDDGRSTSLREEAIAMSEFAELSEDEEEEESGSSSSDESSSSAYDDKGSQGLGFLDSSILQRGIQKDTTIFAKWENHTRGVASKMMANMGYREGMGLGASGQGMVNPIPVRVLPAKQSLDLAVEARNVEESKEGQGVKKRSRGGKRKRDKKFAAMARAAKEEEELAPDVFTLINSQLTKHHETLNGSSKKHQRNKDSGEGKEVNRRSLLVHNSEVKNLRTRVGKLEEMANRNRKEKAVYEAAMRKLTETRKALADAEAAHASASNTVTSREQEKRWLKF